LLDRRKSNYGDWADRYYTSIDTPTKALHPQIIMAFTFADQVLPRKIRLYDENPDSDKARL
jgi:hypothetical protein